MHRYDKGRRIDAARGIPRLVSSDEAREHVEMLVQNGISKRTIAIHLGYGPATSLISVLKRDRIRRTTHLRIMEITVDAVKANEGWVSPVGPMRRLRALTRMGWKLVDMRDRSGLNLDTLSNIRNGLSDNVTERTFDAIREMYDEMSMVDGGDIRARRLAERNRWAPPLAWDDIDNPASLPDGVLR